MPHIQQYPPLQETTNRQLSNAPTFHDPAFVVDSDIGAWTEIGRNSIIIESSFGDYSYTDGDVSIIYADIGKFCSIASHVRINPGNHPMERVSQHHFTYRRQQYGFDEVDEATFFDWRREHRCVIGHDVWIGHSATIMPGVHIGTGAVIGAGAVVTRHVAPYTIAVGVPARPLRRRFAESVCEQLLQIAWWDWHHDVIKARFTDFLDVQSFITRYGHVS
jgi:hypothetical protein